jgi:hypothetical protein
MSGVSRGRSVGIVAGYGMDARGVEFESLYGQEFSPLHIVHTGSGAHPTSYLMGTRGYSAGLQRSKQKRLSVHLLLHTS